MKELSDSLIIDFNKNFSEKVENLYKASIYMLKFVVELVPLLIYQRVHIVAH